MVATLTGYKLFRHTSDMSAQDYAWCVANATLLYSGTGLSFADTGLASDTVYYYKLFSAYDVDGAIRYSECIGTSETTQANSVPDYQPWENYPDSPVLTTDKPYQVIDKLSNKGAGWNDILWISASQIQIADERFSGTEILFSSASNLSSYYLNSGVWTYQQTISGTNDYWTYNYLHQANNDIYRNGTVYFAKTTA